MDGIDFSKTFITIINGLILCGLPYMAIWHASKIKSFETFRFDWWMQILTSIVYSAFSASELPALWNRLMMFYSWKLTLPPAYYTLTAWDRYGHLFGYALLILTTWCNTTKKIPKNVINFMG